MRDQSELSDRGVTSLKRTAPSGLARAPIATLVAAQIDDKTPTDMENSPAQASKLVEKLDSEMIFPTAVSFSSKARLPAETPG